MTQITKTTEKVVILHLTYMNIVRSPKFGNKILRSTESDSKYYYEGRNKSECIGKATRAGRYNSSYKKVWETIQRDIN